MKIILVIAIFIISGFCYGQEDLLGLFGKCDSEYSGYVCQQILFKKLLALRKKTENLKDCQAEQPDMMVKIIF